MQEIWVCLQLAWHCVETAADSVLLLFGFGSVFEAGSLVQAGFEFMISLLSFHVHAFETSIVQCPFDAGGSIFSIH